MPLYTYASLLTCATARGILYGEDTPEGQLCGALTVASLLSPEDADQLGQGAQLLYLPESGQRAAYPYRTGQYVLSWWYNGNNNDYRLATLAGETVRLWGEYHSSGQMAPDAMALLAAALWQCPALPELAGQEVALS